MKELLAQVIGIPVNSVAYPSRLLQEPSSQYPIPSSSNGPVTLKQNKVDRMNKLGGKADNFANGIREHGVDPSTKDIESQRTPKCEETIAEVH